MGEGTAVVETDLRARLRRQVLRYSSGPLRDDAEDIAQLAWLRLQNEPDPGPSLIARAAWCAVIDEARRHRRRREVPIEDAPVPRASSREDPERSAAARETGRAIRSCLGRMAATRRVAVTLYLQGHTGPETGRILGWSLKKAENMIFRGLGDLRRCLAHHGVVP